MYLMHDPKRLCLFWCGAETPLQAVWEAGPPSPGSAAVERQGAADGAGWTGGQGHCNFFRPKDAEVSSDKAHRRQGGHMEDRGPRKTGPRIGEKTEKMDLGGEQKKKGPVAHAVLRKGPIILVAQGQEVKSRIII